MTLSLGANLAESVNFLPHLTPIQQAAADAAAVELAKQVQAAVSAASAGGVKPYPILAAPPAAAPDAAYSSHEAAQLQDQQKQHEKLQEAKLALCAELAQVLAPDSAKAATVRDAAVTAAAQAILRLVPVPAAAADAAACGQEDAAADDSAAVPAAAAAAGSEPASILQQPAGSQHRGSPDATAQVVVAKPAAASAKVSAAAAGAEVAAGSLELQAPLPAQADADAAPAAALAVAPAVRAQAAAAADVALSHGLAIVWLTYLAFLCQGSCCASEDLLLRLGSKWRWIVEPIADSWAAAGVGGMGVPQALRDWMKALPASDKKSKEEQQDKAVAAKK